MRLMSMGPTRQMRSEKLPTGRLCSRNLRSSRRNGSAKFAAPLRLLAPNTELQFSGREGYFPTVVLNRQWRIAAGHRQGWLLVPSLKITPASII